MEKVKKRILKLDFIRILALFFVVSVHFLLNSEFYITPVDGVRMYVMIMVRSVFISCVPLFMMLTGYLQNRKKLSKEYYKGIIKVLITYLMIAIVYALFKKFYMHQEMSLFIFLQNVFGYMGTDYAWYLEMYLGLFLLIPFLNMVIENENQKQFHVLLYTLVILVGIPSIVNITRYKIFPAWWTSIYPILYYYLGAYLSRYELKVSGKKCFLLLVLLVLVDGIFNCYRSYGTTFVWGTWNDWQSLSVMMVSLLIFYLMLKIKIQSENKRVIYFFKLISDSCFGAYLISCLFDKIVYQKLIEMIPNVKDRFFYAPVVVLIVFGASLVTSIGIELVCRGVTKLIKRFQIERGNENEKISSH